jgi:transcriptional regulator
MLEERHHLDGSADQDEQRRALLRCRSGGSVCRRRHRILPAEGYRNRAAAAGRPRPPAVRKLLISRCYNDPQGCGFAIVDYLGIVVDYLGIMSRPSDLVQGTLDLLILKTLATEPRHGWAIAKRIQQVSSDVLQVTQGSLYPALHRLEQQGWLKATWVQTESGREAKVYALTAAGRKQLTKELESWDRLSSAIRIVLREA